MKKRSFVFSLTLTLVPTAAFAAPSGPALRLPWACGRTEACTQGHNGGSHTGNSAWAWDFALQEGEEIWAASAGVVTHLRMDSNQGGCNSAYATEGNFITIDHGDGTSIIYAHMQYDSSPLAVGDAVEVGDLIARVGHTGYACGSHLHMAVQTTCGSSHCASVQAAFADVGDPSASTSYESNNCPVCPIVLAGDVAVIDDQDAGCLERETKAWWSAHDGHADHFFYTYATDAAADVSIGTWRFGVEIPGDYLVEVFIPAMHATTEAARYRVHHADGVAERVVDQAAAKDWQPLGTFAFTGEPSERIVLGDATGENIDALARAVAFDAVRFTFMPPTESDETDTGGEPHDDDDASSTGDDRLPPDEQAESEDTFFDADPDEPGALPPGYGAPGPVHDCVCSSRRRGVPWWLAIVPLVRRRARAINRPPAA